MTKKRKKIVIPKISPVKMKKIWKETFGKEQKVISDSTPFGEYIIYAIFANLITIIFALIVHKWLPPEVPLFYGKPQGSEQLASSWLLVLPGLISLLILFTNLAIVSLIKNDFSKKTLVLAAIGATFFSTITTFKIIFLVGSF